MGSVADQHVFQRNDGTWAVMPEGGEKASKILHSKTEAIRMADETAGRNGVDVIIHEEDGTLTRIDNNPHVFGGIH